MSMKVTEENVLVVRRSLFDELGAFHGLNFEPKKYLDAFLSRGNNFFLPRPEAEINPAYKQIIPYALIAFQNKVAYYVRGKKAGEKRLVAKGSIGIGGHMNETDESLFAMDEEAYCAGVEREVNEEIKIDAPFQDRIVALLNDDTPEAGRAQGGKTRGNDHRPDISREGRIVDAPRNHGDVVADLSGFARPFVAVAA